MSEQVGRARIDSAVVGEAATTLPATRRAGVLGERRRRPSARPFDRPRFLAVFTAVFFFYLFAPIVVVFLFSFNSKRSTQVFGHFSLNWYQQLLRDPAMLTSMRVSIEIAFATMIAATALGTMLAFGLVRARSRLNRPTDVTMLMNLISPEIVTAIALLLVFSELGQLLVPYGIKFQLSIFTVALGHITWAIAYVAIIVRGRLASLNREIEEAAMDLGATQVQAVRLVTLPLLWPAIIAAALLCFVMSFDDFVTSYFLSGVDTPPLPILIYSSIHFGVTPEINAIGTVMMSMTMAIVLVALLIYSRQQQARLSFLAE
jgi:spermidine/putrescine transport system permease protein/putrescine transport system permease protein